MIIRKTLATCLLVVAFFMSCTSESKDDAMTYLSLKTQYNSSEPSLHKTNDGRIYLSWIQTDSLKQSQLLFSELKKNTWTDSQLIAEGDNWFVNWADFPSIASFGEHNLVAHYLQKSAVDTYAYDVKLRISNDNGNSWSSGITPHNDNTNTEHGFVSKIGLNSNTFMSVWLDGRQFSYAEKDSTLPKQMALRSAIINASGTNTQDFVIDHRVCDCCQTDMTMTNNGPMVVYRDRSDDEIRDIYFSQFINNAWTSPKVVHNDNWHIAGCPVNGPAISSNGETTIATWFTVQNEMSKVKAAFYNKSKQEFGTSIQLDFIDPLGRIDTEVIDDNSALISWVDAVNNRTSIQLQRVYKDGNKSEIFTVSDTSPKRASGFPRFVVDAEYAYLAWTDSNNGKLQVKTAKVRLDSIK